MNSEAYSDLVENHLQSAQNVAVCSVLLCCCNMIARGLTKHIKQFNKLRVSSASCMFTRPRTDVIIICLVALGGKKLSTNKEI